MIVYNVTIKIHHDIEAGWLKWQQEEHIPEVMTTALFFDYKFYRLLEQNENDGATYIVQYFASSMDNYFKYINEFAEGFRQKIFIKWGNKFIAFRTVMETVD